MESQTTTDESHLDLTALRGQDPAQFELLYHMFAPPLRRYLLRVCRDPDLTNDLLQETFRKAYSALPHTTPAMQVRHWLYTIATNTARSAARTAYWRRVRAFDTSALDLRPADEEGIESRAIEIDLIERTLAAIKPDDAALVVLHWHEGFSIDELCGILALSRAALKKRLYRARKAFSAAYAHQCANVEPGPE